MSGAGEHDWKPSFNPWIIAVSVILATFIEVLDTTIVSVAQPNMAGSLSSTNEEATWVLTSYLVANAIVLPASGWLSLRFGRKRFLLLGTALFIPTASLVTLIMELKGTTPRHVALISSTMISFCYILNSFIPNLVGKVADQTGSFVPGFIGLTLFSFISVLAGYLLPETGPKAKSPGQPTLGERAQTT